MSASYLKLLNSKSPIAPPPAPPEHMVGVWDLRVLTGEVEVPVVYPTAELAAVTEGVVQALALALREWSNNDSRRVMRLHLAWLTHDHGGLAVLLGCACAAGITTNGLTKRQRVGRALQGGVPLRMRRDRNGVVSVGAIFGSPAWGDWASTHTPRQLDDELERHPELLQALRD